MTWISLTIAHMFKACIINSGFCLFPMWCWPKPRKDAFLEADLNAPPRRWSSSHLTSFSISPPVPIIFLPFSHHFPSFSIIFPSFSIIFASFSHRFPFGFHNFHHFPTISHHFPFGFHHFHHFPSISYHFGWCTVLGLLGLVEEAFISCISEQGQVSSGRAVIPAKIN